VLYVVQVASMVGLYVILASSLNLISGYGGLVTVAHAAFYGIGAYISAVVATRLGLAFPVSVFAATLAGGLVGWGLSKAVGKLRGDYFVLMTLAIQVVAVEVFKNWTEVTGGAVGLAGIPTPFSLGSPGTQRCAFLLVIWGFAGFAVLTVWRVAGSPLGRVVQAIRESEALPQALGKDVDAAKGAVFFVSSGLAALAGALYAYHARFVDPSSFTVHESIFIVAVLVVGGAGSTAGPVAGALLLVVVPEVLRFIGIPSAVAGSLRQMLFGLLLVIVVMFRPAGLVGRSGIGRVLR